MPFGNSYYSGYAIYATDGDFTWGDDDGYEEMAVGAGNLPFICCRNNNHMLEITDVRVERLRSMSQDDARAEVLLPHLALWKPGLAFRELWDSILARRLESQPLGLGYRVQTH